MTNNKGGARPGAGRPKGSKNLILKETRKNHQIRAFDDEWKQIERYSKFIKKGGEALMEEIRPCTKEEIKSMLADQVILADDCKRQLKRMKEHPLMDDDKYKPFFEKALENHILMIEFFINYLKKFN